MLVLFGVEPSFKFYVRSRQRFDENVHNSMTIQRKILFCSDTIFFVQPRHHYWEYVEGYGRRIVWILLGADRSKTF